MEPVSGRIAAYAPPAAAKVKGPPEVQRTEAEEQSRAAAPARDGYTPEEKQEPAGRYWLGQDGDGQPKVYFDDPNQDKKADGPERKASERKAESRTCNTDQVDREIERLKEKQEALEQQIQSETDDAEIEKLEKELARVERELRRKDNDAYRRQHAVFS